MLHPFTAAAELAKAGLRLPDFEGSSHGFPILRDLQGKKLADGEFLQWVEGGRLHIRNSYDFGNGHRVEEVATFQQSPTVIQETLYWREFLAGILQRQFEVDLRSGRAAAQKREEEEMKQWSENLKIEPGRAFAGVGFTIAIKSVRERLRNGEKVELQAIGFTPKPRLVSVEISYAGLDEVMMSGRTIRADRFVIHPQIPKIARLVVEAPDTRIWLTHLPPAGFVRWEGAFAEPDDPIVRVDLLPGDPSRAAEPVR